MFIDTLEKTHPERLLYKLEVNTDNFFAFFDLPNDKHLKVVVSVQENNGMLSVFETIQETGKRSIHEEYTMIGPTLLLRWYLKKVVDFHYCVGSLHEMILQKLYEGWE